MATFQFQYEKGLQRAKQRVIRQSFLSSILYERYLIVAGFHNGPVLQLISLRLLVTVCDSPQRWEDSNASLLLLPEDPIECKGR